MSGNFPWTRLFLIDSELRYVRACDNWIKVPKVSMDSSADCYSHSVKNHTSTPPWNHRDDCNVWGIGPAPTCVNSLLHFFWTSVMSEIQKSGWDLYWYWCMVAWIGPVRACASEILTDNHQGDKVPNGCLRHPKAPIINIFITIFLIIVTVHNNNE